MYEASGSDDTTFRIVEGATHYYQDQPDQLAEAVDATVGWLDSRGLL